MVEPARMSHTSGKKQKPW